MFHYQPFSPPTKKTTAAATHLLSERIAKWCCCCCNFRLSYPFIAMHTHRKKSHNRCLVCWPCASMLMVWQANWTLPTHTHTHNRRNKEGKSGGGGGSTAANFGPILNTLCVWANRGTRNDWCRRRRRRGAELLRRTTAAAKKKAKKRKKEAQIRKRLRLSPAPGLGEVCRWLPLLDSHNFLLLLVLLSCLLIYWSTAAAAEFVLHYSERLGKRIGGNSGRKQENKWRKRGLAPFPFSFSGQELHCTVSTLYCCCCFCVCICRAN